LPFARLAALSGLISVAAGAFGAHALRAHLTADQLQTWETAARYQMYHVVPLFIVAWLRSNGPCPWADRAGWAFLIGTLLFSGSLYALALTGVTKLGTITPLGGVAFLAGWAMLALAVGGTAPER
jgi:uncharacterized membrane protein YgdD (TMEM256/DUF423 family)